MQILSHIPVPSAAPQNLTGTALDSQSLLFTWLPPPLEFQNGVIREYRVIIVANETRENFAIASNQTQLTFTAAHPCYTYIFTVAAVTIEEGLFSLEYTITTPEDCKLFIAIYT